jgi:hypothetical protein
MLHELLLLDLAWLLLPLLQLVVDVLLLHLLLLVL